jgi:hypothetical protein
MKRSLVKLVYDFVTDHFWISFYMRKIFFSFLSVRTYCTAYTVFYYYVLINARIYPQFMDPKFVKKSCVIVYMLFYFSKCKHAPVGIRNRRTIESIACKSHPWMRSSRVWMSNEFDPSILRHSGIWGAADETVLNNVLKKKKSIKISLLKYRVQASCGVRHR